MIFIDQFKMIISLNISNLGNRLPFNDKCILPGLPSLLRTTIFLILRISCIASSSTPGNDENSLLTPLIITDVTADPSTPAYKIRRNALPRVIPKPGSNG